MDDETRREIDSGPYSGPWAEANVRARMAGLSEAKLEQISRDDARRQIERDVALDMLETMRKHGEVASAVDLLTSTAEAIREQTGISDVLRKAYQQPLDELNEKQAQRLAAREGGGIDWPDMPGMEKPQDIYSSENARLAHEFAQAITEAGFPCKAARTARIANHGEVKDGWVVNLRDTATEIGVVACWWGRRHFTAFIEISGHNDLTDETARSFAAFLSAARDAVEGDG